MRGQRECRGNKKKEGAANLPVGGKERRPLSLRDTISWRGKMFLEKTLILPERKGIALLKKNAYSIF